MNTLHQVFDNMFAAKDAADAQLKQAFGINDKNPAMLIGDYALWDIDPTRFGMSHLVTGEAGVFNKADFEAHVKAFFGMNF
jgi:hypothetical protein